VSEHTPSSSASGVGRKTISVILVMLAFVFALVYGKHQYQEHKAKAEAEARARAVAAAKYAAEHPPAPMFVPEYPISGAGHATKEVGLKAYLDPMKTYVLPSRPARYVFIEDTSVFFDDTEGARVDTTEHHQVWLDMPPGEYLVYPIGADKVYFRWWQ